MDLEEIKKLSEYGEKLYINNDEELAPIPRADRNPAKISLEDFIDQLKSFYIADNFIEIVGGIPDSNDNKGADIDILIKDDLLNDHLKEAVVFRIYRMFSDILKVPYDDVPNNVHILFSPSPYTNHIPLYRLKVERIDSVDIIKMAEEINKENNKNSISVVSKSKDRIIAGYCSVTIVDSENQIITKEALEKALLNFMQKANYRNVMLSHSAIQVGEVIEKYNEYETKIDDRGMFIVVRLRDDLEIANKVWEDILSGKLNGFSIHAEIDPNGYHYEDGVLVIDNMNLFEISVTNSPVNELARFRIISKGSKNYDNFINVNVKNVKGESNIKEGADLNMSTKYEKYFGGFDMEDFDLEKELDRIENIGNKVEPDIKKDEVKTEDVPVISKEDLEERVTKLEKQVQEIIALLKTLPRFNRYPMPGKYPYPETGKDMSEAVEKGEVVNVTEEIKEVKKSFDERTKIIEDAAKEFENIKKMLGSFDERLKKMEEIPNKKTKVEFKEDAEDTNDFEDVIKVEKGEVFSA